MLSQKEKQENLVIARKLDPEVKPEKGFDQLIRTKKMQALLPLEDVNVDQSRIDAELNFYKNGQPHQFQKLLTDYFDSRESLFVHYVLIPQVLEAVLREHYNTQFGLNNDTYNKAENILESLDSGQTFEDQAKTKSDDKVSAQLGGDLGFVAAAELMPELSKAIQNAKVGEVKKQIVISRLGYHIIYPVETAEKDNVKVWHVKHILIQTSGFDSWLNEQLKQIGVWHIGKI